MTTLKKSMNNNNFQHRKEQCLSKKDKSSAGKIDKHCVTICNLINNNFNDEYYTTSSCSGRCFIYNGTIGKGSSGSGSSHANYTNNNDNEGDATATTNNGSNNGMFIRYRVNHEKIINPKRYFNLNTLDDDPTGGDGDEINDDYIFYSQKHALKEEDNSLQKTTLWLRYEPFILHVSCISLQAAYNFLQITRPTFKNIGLTSWSMKKKPVRGNNNNTVNNDKYLIAIWGDEGMDVPLTIPTTNSNSNDTSNATTMFLFEGNEQYLADLVNDRQNRNWYKISQFQNSIQTIINNGGFDNSTNDNDNNNTSTTLPKRYDVIGDVALFHLPKTITNNANTDANEEISSSSNNELLLEELKQIGQNIITKNKSINICVVRTNILHSYMRSPTSSSLVTLASRYPNRSTYPSLLTTHIEYNVPCYIDVTNTFFTPRMSFERQRIINQIIDKQQTQQHSKEHVFIPFAGCGMEAFQIAYKDLYKSITILELNPYAIRCLQRSLQKYIKNYNKKHGIRISKECDNNYNKIEYTKECSYNDNNIFIHEGDVLDTTNHPTIFHDKERYYDRIIAPRPKYENDKPDILNDNNNTKDCLTTNNGIQFLKVLIPLLKPNVGVCHWYDFCAYHELIVLDEKSNKKGCERIQDMINSALNECFCDDDDNYDVEFLNVINVSSVAKKQYRICVDFRIVTKS